MGNRLGLIDDFNYILKLAQIRTQIRYCFFLEFGSLREKSV